MKRSLAGWLSAGMASVAAMFAIALCVTACGPREPQAKAGALYSVDDGEGFFRIAKVLAVEPEGVHVRLYKNKFKARPTQVEFASLSLGSIRDGGGFGLGHLPLSNAAFRAWDPVYVAESAVQPDELEGYREWKDAKGGYFGAKR